LIGDLTRRGDLDVVDDSYDVVFHLAARGHVAGIGQEAYRSAFEINVGGTENLLDALSARRIDRFVHVSSTAAVGLIPDRPVNEEDLPNPATPYQHSKLRSEEVVREKTAGSTIQSVIVRPCMIYGPGGEGEFLKIVRLMAMGVFPRVGLGRALTPLVHVRDVADGIVAAGVDGKPGSTYFLAGSQSYPMEHLRRVVLSSLGLWRPAIYVPVWAGWLAGMALELAGRAAGKLPIATRRNILSTAANRTFDIGRARRDFGYEPRVEPEEGIPETIDWFKERGLL
jgi:nucleoside-diphosphate-sugar epimerase